MLDRIAQIFGRGFVYIGEEPRKVDFDGVGRRRDVSVPGVP